MKKILSFIFCFCLSSLVYGGTLVNDTLVYKRVGKKELHLFVTSPIKHGKDLPCLLFFYGGGWNTKNINQFEPYCEYFAKRNYVCVRAEYRVHDVDGSTPFQSLSDARSAVRYIRKHADELGIDTSKIAAGGGSAGGHLSTACATVKKYDENSDDLSISCIPNALLLYNPVIDNGPSGYGFERIGAEYKDFSPLHNLYKGMPPAIFFLGTQDKLIPVETAKYFKKSMEILGNRCDLYLYEGEGHGFFNTYAYRVLMINLTEKFLKSLNW